MRLPSVKTLSAITAYPMKLRMWLERYRDGQESLRAVMEEANELIGGHGVEYIRHKEDAFTGPRVFGLECVNMGDPYAATLLFDHDKGAFIVGSWGSLVESRPNSYE